MNMKAKRYTAYILCIIVTPVIFLFDVIDQQKQVFRIAWKNIKRDVQSNNRIFEVNMKMLDMK